MARRIGDYLRANVLGLIAVFIALTAGAYAAQKAAKNSVVSKSIKDGQVKGADLAADSVDASKVLDNSLGGADIDEAKLTIPGDGNSGGTVKSVSAGPGLTGGPITNAGTLSLAACPNGQLLKSTGPGYTCAADADTDTTYSAGTGLDLSAGNDFSIEPDGVREVQIASNSVGTDEIDDASIRFNDLGIVISNIPDDIPSFANGTCAGLTVNVASGAAVGDLVFVSSSVPMPPNTILTGQIEPGNTHRIQLCNLSGANADPDPAVFRLLVIKPPV